MKIIMVRTKAYDIGYVTKDGLLDKEKKAAGKFPNKLALYIGHGILKHEKNITAVQIVDATVTKRKTTTKTRKTPVKKPRAANKTRSRFLKKRK